jgi:hypothetical protein
MRIDEVGEVVDFVINDQPEVILCGVLVAVSGYLP